MDELAARALIARRRGDEVESRGTAKPGWPNFSSTSTAGDEFGPPETDHPSAANIAIKLAEDRAGHAAVQVTSVIDGALLQSP